MIWRAIMFTFMASFLICGAAQQISAQLIISEILYDPLDCPDTQCEWVELYNAANQSVSTEHCSLDAKALEIINVTAHSYVLVGRNRSAIQEHFVVANETYIIESLISLRNSGENVQLNGSTICNSSFDYSLFSSQNMRQNHSVEINRAGEWLESLYSGGSPGSENSVYNFSREFPGLRISEVLANPVGTDSAQKPFGEWIEVYNSGPFFVDLQDYFFSTGNISDELYISETTLLREDRGTVLAPGEFVAVYRNQDSDFSLGNSQGVVHLWNQDTLIDSFSYSTSSEGNSWSYANGSWFLSVPSPNRANVVQEGCDWSIRITSDTHLSSQNISFNVSVLRLLGRSANVSVRGRIENQYGIPVKTYAPWTDSWITSLATKTYSPRLSEGQYQVIFELENLSCVDSDPNSNVARAMFGNNPLYNQHDSFVTIEKVYLGVDEVARWGEQLRVKISSLRANETKQSIQAWFELDGKQIGTRSRFNLEHQFTQTTVTIPLQLPLRCTAKDHKDSVVLHIEGLGDVDAQEITVLSAKHSTCDQSNTSISATTQKQKPSLVYVSENVSVQSPVTAILAMPGSLQEENYSVWSYVFRGPKCYSCENESLARDQNQQNITLLPNKLQFITFQIPLDETVKSQLPYTLRVVFLKEGRKTSDSLSSEFYVIERVSKEPLLVAQAPTDSSSAKNSLTGAIISSTPSQTTPSQVLYASSSQKVKGLAGVIFIIVCVVLTLSVLFSHKP